MGEGRESRLPCLLYADALVLCRELEDHLRALVGCFVRKRVEGDQVKWAMIEGAREVCGSVRVEKKNLKRVVK